MDNTKKKSIRSLLQSVFGISLLFCGLLALWGMRSPQNLTETITFVTDFCLKNLDWFFLLSCTLFIFTSIFLAISKFGRIKLGKPNENPEFSFLSWIAMLFAAGMGAGLLFWGVAEPLMHFAEPPPGNTEAFSYEAARLSFIVTNLHWGFHAWGIYAISGLCLAYFSFNKGNNLLPSIPITVQFKKNKWFGKVADVIAVVSVTFGVVGSLGMGIIQIKSGLQNIFGIDGNSLFLSLIILVLLTVVFMISAGTALNKGIKILSNINISLAIFLMLYVLFLGPTKFILTTFVTSIGDYLSHFIELSTKLYPFSGKLKWSRVWTLTYLIWWIAWAPFVGIFIARISRGRTIREFVFGVIFVPTIFSILWFAVFGGAGLHIELAGNAGLSLIINEDPSKALFQVFMYYPGSTFLSVIALFLVFIFLVTSADSATFVLGMMTTNGSMNPPVLKKLTWGIIIALLTASALISGGGVEVMKAVAICGAFPFCFIIISHIACLLVSLKDETKP